MPITRHKWVNSIHSCFLLISTVISIQIIRSILVHVMQSSHQFCTISHTECNSATTQTLPILNSYRDLVPKYKNKNKQQNAIKANTLKAIPKYYNGVLVVSTFFFIISPTRLFLLKPLLHSVNVMINPWIRITTPRIRKQKLLTLTPQAGRC
jgi:hypothetical protein